MSGGSTYAATREMEALHVGQTPETKVSTVRQNLNFALNWSMNACPCNIYSCCMAASAYCILMSVHGENVGDEQEPYQDIDRYYSAFQNWSSRSHDHYLLFTLIIVFSSPHL